MGVGGNYVWCLVIVAVFMGLREAKKANGEALKASYEGQALRRGLIFLGGLHASRHHETFFSGSLGVFTMEGFHDLFLHGTFRSRVFNVLDQRVFSMKSS